MAITVAILINGECIAKKTAKRVSLNGDIGKYECDEGKLFFHNYSRGAKPLAKNLLESMKVPTVEEYVNQVYEETVARLEATHEGDKDE